MSSILSKDKENSKVAIRTHGGVKIFDYMDIISCEAHGRYTKLIFISDNFILVSKHLKLIEDLLPDSDFFRIHKSTLVNIHHILELKPNHCKTLILDNKSEVVVSGRRRPYLIKLLKKKAIFI